MLNRVTLRVTFILNSIGMLNKVISCVDYFKSDWHAKYGMIMYELLYSNRSCGSRKFPKIVWSTMNCRQTILSSFRQFKVTIEEPPARNSVK